MHRIEIKHSDITMCVKALMLVHTEEFKSRVLKSILVKDKKISRGTVVFTNLENAKNLVVEGSYPHHKKDSCNIFLYYDPYHSKFNINCDDFVVKSAKSDDELFISNTKAELWYTRALLELKEDTYGYSIIDFLNNLILTVEEVLDIDLKSVSILDDVDIPEAVALKHIISPKLLTFIRSLFWAYFGDEIYSYTFHTQDPVIKLEHISRHEATQCGYGHLRHDNYFRCIRHLILDGEDFYVKPWKFIQEPLKYINREGLTTKIETVKRHNTVTEFINKLTESQINELQLLLDRMETWTKENPIYSFKMYDESRPI